MTSKTEIRNEMKEKRRALTKQQQAAAGERVARQIASMREWTESLSLYCYVSCRGEMDTFPLMQKALAEGKRLFVPKTEGGRILFFEICDLASDLAPGAYGILEPTTRAEDISRSGLLILPGLAFDRQFYRLGYGGGFYDRYLSRPNTHFKIATGYDFQLVETVFHEPFDQPVDCIVTESGCLRKERTDSKN